MILVKIFMLLEFEQLEKKPKNDKIQPQFGYEKRKNMALQRPCPFKPNIIFIWYTLINTCSIVIN